MVDMSVLSAILLDMLRFNYNHNKMPNNELDREKLFSRIHNACPHAFAEFHHDHIVLHITISTPMGTTNHICSQCNAVFYDNNMALYVQRKYGSSSGLQKLQKDRKKFTKLLKKEGFLA